MIRSKVHPTCDDVDRCALLDRLHVASSRTFGHDDANEPEVALTFLHRACFRSCQTLSHDALDPKP